MATSFLLAAAALLFLSLALNLAKPALYSSFLEPNQSLLLFFPGTNTRSALSLTDYHLYNTCLQLSPSTDHSLHNNLSHSSHL